MNRRLFCFNALAFSVAQLGAKAQSTALPDEAQALWSILVPQIELQPGKGYLLARETSQPDGLPYLQTGSHKTAIQRAMDATNQGPRTYETTVPEDMQQASLEAVQDASARQSETVQIARLSLNKPYRLLTNAEVKSYRGLSPAVTAPGWKQDTKAARYFKGWDNLASVSVPYFNKAKTLALICGDSLSGCSGSQWHFFAKSGSTWKKLDWNTEGTCVTA